MDIQALVRKNILNMKPYSSARDEFKGTAEIFLDANENPYPSPYNRYPDPLQWRVKEKLAALKGVKPEQIFLGNGSDEGIDLIILRTEPGFDPHHRPHLRHVFRLRRSERRERATSTAHPRLRP